MKRIILMLFMLPLAILSNAQSASLKTIDAGEGQQWWGYYKGSESLRGMGYGIRGHYDVAIFIPGNEGIGQGATIHAVRFYLNTATNLENVKVWASKQLPEKGKPETADIEMKPLAQSDIVVRTEGTNDVAFTPFEVPSEGVYVGYSFDITSIGSEDTYYPVVVTKGTEDINNALWLYVSSNTSWVNCYDWGGNYGNLALKVLISGNMKDHAVEAVSAEDAVAVVGTQANVPLKIFNWGAAGVNSLGYTITSDGEESEEMTYQLDKPFKTFHSDTTLLLPVPTDPVAVKKLKTIYINKVNGEPNNVEEAEKHTTASVISVDQPAYRRTVMEEFTGTWCGWCVRGLKGIEKSAELFGDQFIPIAVHGSDIMAIQEYLSWRQNVGGLPTSLINRYYECDPYYGSKGMDREVGSKYGVDEDIRKMLLETVEGSVYSYALLKQEGNISIDITTETTFRFTSDDAPYALAYAVLGNNMEGPGSDWVQENYYPRYKNDDKYNKDADLSEYINGQEKMRNMTYQHVPIAAQGIDNGIEGSIASTIHIDDPQTFNTTIDLSDNSLLDYADGLEVVTMLINTKTGRIVNAHKATVVPYDATGINTTDNQSDSKAMEIFNAKGQKTNSLQPGLNIIRMSNGSVKKIFFE